MHSIKTVCQLTGLSPDTLRAWERRYGAVQPGRDDNGRRLYRAEDLARLRLLRQAVALGQPIHRVARLSSEELERLAHEARERDVEPQMNDVVARLLDAVANYRADSCDEILGVAIAGLSPRDAVRLVLTPALVEAGSRWHAGTFSAAQEHLLTASVERIVMTTVHTLHKAARGPGMLFGTLAGERHAVGSLLAAFLAASQGIRCIYLGADLPPSELGEAAVRSDAAVVALSVVTAVPHLESQIELLCRELPPTSEAWIGGSAAQDLDPSRIPENCIRFSNFDDFSDRAEILSETRT